MNRVSIIIIFLSAFLSAHAGVGLHNVEWSSQSRNSSESMPCGGGDVGLNVWVEDGDLLFYIARSGAFDNNNTLLKLGRVRLRLSPNPFLEGDFIQKLDLEQGCIYVKSGSVVVRVWVDVFNPQINIDIDSKKGVKTELFYENWRHRDRELRKNESNQNSYKWASPAGLLMQKDSVAVSDREIIFFHRNSGENIFDATVRQQGLEQHKEQMYNPIKDLTFGGVVRGTGLRYAGRGEGSYAGTEFGFWRLETDKPQKKSNITITLHTQQCESIAQWVGGVEGRVVSDRAKNIEWWREYWSRSFIVINSDSTDSKGFEVGRNYQLFRYMLGCNAHSEFPTKFNGGLFTYDPCFVDSTLCFTPDFRKWGGGTHTAQNQRLVYFPMLKSGDFELMTPQFDFYNRLLPTAVLRSEQYWGHDGACFTEQLENFGLPNPSEYGWKRPLGYDPGMEYNAWLEYQWDTVLEFCFMILQTAEYADAQIDKYIPLVEQTLIFFDKHYQYLALKRGRKSLDQDGKLVLYPGSACETYKMAYNATSTIAALQTVTEALLRYSSIALDSTKREYYSALLNRIPEIKTRQIGGHTTIAPAWLWERVNNVESPQLYPLFPWGIYGVGRPDLDIARNTWLYDDDVVKFRSHVGWKQDAIWAAQLGLTDQATELITLKLQSSATRFPAFWGPGYDWTPDHNWGGSAMIALQEMLMQTDGNKIFLLPAWPEFWDVHFKLHAPNKTTIECRYRKGVVEYLNVEPAHRRADIKYHLTFI